VGMNAGAGAGVVGKNTAGGPGLQAVVSGKGVPPLSVNSSARVPNLNADKLDGVDAAGFVPSSAVRRVGPVTLAPIVGGVAYTPLATFGQLSFVGYCFDSGTQQSAEVVVFASDNHAAFVSVTAGNNGVGVEQNLDFYAGFPVTSSSNYLPDGRQAMYPGVGTVLSANGHQVSFNVYAGQNVMGLTNQKCVFGGTFAAN
jgi:hypothetical protein